MNSDGQIYSWSTFRSLLTSTGNPQLSTFIKSYFSAYLYSEIEYNDAIYIIWHNNNGESPVAIHQFAPGSSLITSTYITPVVQRENAEGEVVDVYNTELSTVKEFVSILTDVNNNDFDRLDDLVTDRFFADTFWGGKMNLAQFKASVERWTNSRIEGKIPTMSMAPLSQIANSYAVVSHDQWSNESNQTLFSVLDIFYFDIFSQGDDRKKIMSLTMYNSTSNMQQTLQIDTF